MITCCVLQPLLDIVIYAAKLTAVIGAQVRFSFVFLLPMLVIY